MGVKFLMQKKSGINEEQGVSFSFSFSFFKSGFNPYPGIRRKCFGDDEDSGRGFLDSKGTPYPPYSNGDMLM